MHCSVWLVFASAHLTSDSSQAPTTTLPSPMATASPSPLTPLPLSLSTSFSLTPSPSSSYPPSLYPYPLHPLSPPIPPTPSGEPVLWYERCRIRHLLTQQYLAVERREGQNVLTLKESKPGPEFDQDTQFRLFPVISGEDEIKYETYARINHPHTKTWLHANKGGCMRVQCRLYSCDSIIKSTTYV